MSMSSRTLSPHRSRSLALLGAFALAALAATSASAASLQDRLKPGASLGERTELPQGVSRRLQGAASLGHLQADAPLETMSVVLAPSASQAAALQTLLAQQRDPNSANYHKWLSPTEFGARFGTSDSDLQVLRNWLTSQGLQVTGVAASRNQIQFSGTASAVESAFSTSLGRFRMGDQVFFENSSAPQIPAAFRGIVSGITGLSSFRMAPHSVRRIEEQAANHLRADYTSSNNTSIHYLLPYDVRQIYSANALISSGYNGSGISIGVIGQSAIDSNQVALFQGLTGQTSKAPTQVLVPNTGISTLYQGDESESEVDLEYASGTAPGANLLFIYSGSSSNADVITALEYAITTKAASILSLSYGGCEIAFKSVTTTLEPILAQANAQGQTVVVSSGDAGAASCEDFNATSAVSGAIVSYPASSPYVTGVGGTVLNDGTGNYWAGTNNSQGGSALSYIPESAWNDTTSTSGFSASGGGPSQLFSKPNWQTGTGVPADSARDVPDVAFASSVSHDPFLLCTSDTSFTGTTSSGTPVTGACTSSTFGGFVIGGTSLAAPSFAGMLALAVQANNGTALGNINPTLYALAAGGSSASVFNDITSGNNVVPCVFGSQNCSGGSAAATGSLGFDAGPGYDEVTGLGSINMGGLSAALAPAAAAVAKVPTVAILQFDILTGTSTYTITVSGSNTATVPTGTINASLDGGTPTAYTLGSGSNNVNYQITTTGLAPGNHTITAVYSGDANFSPATASVTFAASSTVSTATGTLALALTPGTLTAINSSASSGQLSLTSTGYTGLVNYSIPNTSARPPSGCIVARSGVSITAGATVQTDFFYSRIANDCNSLNTLIRFGPAATAVNASLTPHALPVRSTASPSSGLPTPLTAVSIAGGLLGGLLLRRRRVWAGSLLALAFTAALLGVSGCGSSSAPIAGNPAPTPTPTPVTTPVGTGPGTGTFTVTLNASSFPAGGVNTTTTFTVVLQ